jgi:transglutaminase superfamily protein
MGFGLVNGRPVFMDLSTDSYFLLEPEEETRFLRRLDEEPAAGVLIASEVGEPVQRTSCVAPTVSVLALLKENRRPAAGDVLRAWRLLAKARSSVRHRSVEAIIAEVLYPCGTDSDRDAAAASALRFASARRFAPVPRNCLSDSVALLHWLHAGGYGATLVFGVKLDPFAAHCWVQAGDLLLNDHIEHVERFAPVRAVQCALATP